MLKQLASLSPKTTINLFFSTNQKTQEYFYANNIVTDFVIMMNGSNEQIKMLPDSIQTRIKEMNEKHNVTNHY